jgi:hypothetical protein
MNRQELYLKALEIVSNEKKEVSSEKIRQLIAENPDHALMLGNVLSSIDEEQEPSECLWKLISSSGKLTTNKNDQGEFVNRRIFQALGFNAEDHLNDKPEVGFVGKIISEVDSFVDPGKRYVLFEWSAVYGTKQAVYNKTSFSLYQEDEYEDESSYEDEEYEESYSYSYDDEDYDDEDGDI